MAAPHRSYTLHTRGRRGCFFKGGPRVQDETPQDSLCTSMSSKVARQAPGALISFSPWLLPSPSQLLLLSPCQFKKEGGLKAP